MYKPKRVGVRKGIDNIVWTYSRYKTTNCMMKYWLNYVKTPRPVIPLNAHILVGKLLHERIENFYQTKGKHIGEPKKKSAEEFADATVGMWNYRTMRLAQEDPDSVAWVSPYEFKWWRPVIKELCMEIYNSYAKEKPPVFIEWKSPLVTIKDEDPFTPGIRMYALLDEIRFPLTIRDHKSREKRITEAELAKDEQFTMYSAIVSMKAAQDEKFARTIGANDDDINELRHDSFSLMEKIKLEHHYLPTWRRTAKNPHEGEERKAEVIYAPRRTKEDFFDLLDKIADAEQKIRSGIFEEDIAAHCSYCLVRKPCDERYEQKKESFIPGLFQNEMFSMAKPTFNPDADVDLYDGIEKPVKKRKRTGQLKFEFMKPPEEVVAEEQNVIA